MILQSSLREIVRQYPDNMAVTSGDSQYSFRQLWDRSHALAVALQVQGVTAGDRVCLLSENSCDAVIAFWAIIQCNAISVFLNEQSPTQAIQQILDDSQPTLIISTSKLSQSRLSEVQGTAIVDLQQLIETSVTAHSSESKLLEDVSLADPNIAESAVADATIIASIIYTSGSTGTPKGVCLTHKNLVCVGEMAAAVYRTTSSDSYLMVVPLHYIHGLMVLMAMHLRGAGIHFMNSFMFPAAVTKKIRDTRVTGFSGVPFHFTALVERGGLLETELPDLRWMGITGGTCPPERLRQIRQAQPDIELHISYGQTECSPRITALDPAKIDSKPDSVGEVARGLVVEFLGDDGKPVSQGEVGELVVAGPTVMHGYWNDPENTRNVIDEKGRLHTGDLAYIDAEGDVFIKGRLQAMIKSAGERIFPEELEAILNSSADIVDVAIVGVADDLYGQRVEAHVILDEQSRLMPEASIKQVKSHCLEHLPLVKTPKAYYLWQKFPLKANGKTDKQTLMNELESSAECYAKF